MARTIKIAAAQVGAVHRTSPRAETLGRMIKLLEDAASQGAEVVLFPETTFTTFFPRYLIEDEEELESFFEHGDIKTAPNTKPLFDKATELGVDISVGMLRSIDQVLPSHVIPSSFSLTVIQNNPSFHFHPSIRVQMSDLMSINRLRRSNRRWRTLQHQHLLPRPIRLHPIKVPQDPPPRRLRTLQRPQCHKPSTSSSPTTKPPIISNRRPSSSKSATSNPET